MKKSIYLSAAALALLAASCSQDDGPIAGADGMTTFRVSLPADLNSRAFGEGTDSKSLSIAVYKVTDGTRTLVMSSFAGENGMNADQIKEITPFGDGFTATYQIPLVKNEKYDIVFWAQNEACDAYKFDMTTGTMTVNYAEMKNFDESRDAFVYSLTDYTSAGNGGEVTLRRPFAQLNVGTSDYAAYIAASGLESQTFGLEVSNVANTLNLIDGKTSTAGTFDGKVTLANADPSEETFPVTTEAYKYLAMGYFLVDEAAVINQVSLNVGSEKFATYNNVPVKANYRTNIFGTLLTNRENFEITINPDFTTPDLEPDNTMQWDGSESAPAEPVVGEDGKRVLTINTPQELAYFGKHYTSKDWYTNMRIDITADMSFEGQNWTPIDLRANGDTGASITFDFQGHTISGLNSPLFDGGNESKCVVSVKNLTIKNSDIVKAAGKYMGVLGGNMQGTLENISIENCTVTAPVVEGQSISVGGIVGFYGSGNAKGCSVSNVTISTEHAESYIGGMFGTMNLNNSNGKTERFIYECKADHVTVTAPAGAKIGAILGRNVEASTYFLNCTATDCSPTNELWGYLASGKVDTKYNGELPF